jgi:tyrosinase
MGLRKNQRNLTAAEKTAFVNALLVLKNYVPSHMGLASRYDDYVQVHMNSMMVVPGWAHRGPAFLAWHREFLRHFELDLQNIDPTVTIPYWEWTINQDPTGFWPGSPFTDDFMGGNGDPPNSKVNSGPFAFSTGYWKLNVKDNPGDPDYLTRDFGTNVPTLPTMDKLQVALNEGVYDVSPWNAASTSGLRNRLEGWITNGNPPNNTPPQLHNRVHVWIGGTMLGMTSLNDPIFWLNHCNIDRQWAIWQLLHPTAQKYLPVSGAPTGHNLNDKMIFFSGGPAPWPDTSTPAEVVNHHALGYWYDTDPTPPY